MLKDKLNFFMGPVHMYIPKTFCQSKKTRQKKFVTDTPSPNVTWNMRFFAALVACQKKNQFAPFRRHSQFVAEFEQFLFQNWYECQCEWFG